jgi:hypothetical protein
MLPAIVETKRNLDGTTERFDCRLVHRDDEYLVLCYLSDKPYVAAGEDIPQGSLTIGHYWRGGDYIVWEIYNPRAGLQGYYIHICRNVTFGENSIEWEDMAVDVWVSANGTSRTLDEDELERSVQSGQVSISEARTILSRTDELRATASSIVAKLKRFDPRDLFAALQ